MRSALATAEDVVRDLKSFSHVRILFHDVKIKLALYWVRSSERRSLVLSSLVQDVQLLILVLVQFAPFSSRAAEGLLGR